MTLRTRLPRLPVLLLLTVALCVLPGLTVESAPAEAASRDPYVAIDSITPKAPTAKSTIRINGSVRNPSRQEFGDVSVRMRILQLPLNSRSLIEQVAASEDQTLGTPVYSRDVQVGEVADRDSGAFELKVPADELGITSFGVYAIAVEALDQGVTQVALQRTFLVYSPDKKSVPKPTKIGWVLPVVDRPHREVGRTFADDALAKRLAAEGRLGRLARAGQAAKTAGTPVTWAVDPAVLDAATVMSKKYRVRTGDGFAPGKGGAAATDFLATMRSATAGGSVLPLPYADVDTTALTRAGLSTDVTTALSHGREVTDEVLGTEVPADLTWPPGGKVDQRGLEALAANGARTAILDDTALPLVEQVSYTPDPLGTVRTSNGPVDALLADSTLTDVLASSTNRPGSAALTEQRFLAETALISAELPNAPRGLVVAPPRDWNPPGDLADDLVTDSADVPWLSPTSLRDLADDKPATELTRQGLVYGKRARRAELPADHLDRVRNVHRSLNRFSSIFNPLPPEFEGYNRALLRAESSAWRYDRRDGRRLLDSVAKTVKSQRAKVRILQHSGQLSLAGEESSVPITIENKLDRPVTVQLSIRSANDRRMQVGELPDTTQIGPRQKKSVKVPIRATGSGVIDVRAQLLTPEGKPYAQPVTFNVQATVYGTVAVIITSSALVVLFAGAGYRVVRRVLRARRQKTASVS